MRNPWIKRWKVARYGLVFKLQLGIGRAGYADFTNHPVELRKVTNKQFYLSTDDHFSCAIAGKTIYSMDVFVLCQGRLFEHHRFEDPTVIFVASSISAGPTEHMYYLTCSNQINSQYIK
jgi:hypothetical protein